MKLTLIYLVSYSMQTWAAFNCPFDSENKFPDVVKISYKDEFQGQKDTFYCTGTIVRKCFVLTAAHCVYGGKRKDRKLLPSEIQINGGARSQEDLGGIAEVFPHPNYDANDPGGRKRDVALLMLKKCVDSGMEINTQPLSSNSQVTVGGFGGLKPGFSWTRQPNRHMGPGEISRFDDDEICLTGATVQEQPLKVLDSKNCIPAGQDSGSAIMQNGKILGVYVTKTELSLPDGKLGIRDICYTNLLHPSTKTFMENVFSAPANLPTSFPSPQQAIPVR